MNNGVITAVAGFVGIIILFSILSSAVVSIPAGSVGVMFDRLSGGVSSTTLGEGWHIQIPFIQSIYPIEVRTLKHEYDASAASKDLQVVNSKVAVSYHIIPSQAPKIYKELGADFSEKIISPAVQEKFKAGTAHFNAEDLIQQREVVKNQISESITILLTKYGIMVDEVSITNFDFSPEFNKAIEAKVVAQQQKLTAENVLAIKEVEAKQRMAEATGVANSTVITAEAQAQAVKLNAEAQAYALQVQRKELSEQLVALRTVEKWNGQLPTYMMGGTSPLMMLNLPNNVTAGQ